MTDVIAGHVSMTFASPYFAMGAIKDGRVRALGVVIADPACRCCRTCRRSPKAGSPGFEAVSWHLVVAPAGTPPAVVNVLHRELKGITAAPELQRMISDMGLDRGRHAAGR